MSLKNNRFPEVPLQIWLIKKLFNIFFKSSKILIFASINAHFIVIFIRLFVCLFYVTDPSLLIIDEEINGNAFVTLTEADLMEMKIKMGPRKNLLDLIQIATSVSVACIPPHVPPTEKFIQENMSSSTEAEGSCVDSNITNYNDPNLNSVLQDVSNSAKTIPKVCILIVLNIFS